MGERERCRQVGHESCSLLKVTDDSETISQAHHQVIKDGLSVRGRACAPRSSQYAVSMHPVCSQYAASIQSLCSQYAVRSSKRSPTHGQKGGTAAAVPRETHKLLHLPLPRHPQDSLLLHSTPGTQHTARGDPAEQLGRPWYRFGHMFIYAHIRATRKCVSAPRVRRLGRRGLRTRYMQHDAATHHQHSAEQEESAASKLALPTLRCPSQHPAYCTRPAT